MPESSATHSFRLKMIGLLDDECARAYCSQGRAASHKKQMANAIQPLGEAGYMLFPTSQISGHGGYGILQFAVAPSCVALTQNVAQPLQRHQSCDIGFAGDRELAPSMGKQ